MDGQYSGGKGADGSSGGKAGETGTDIKPPRWSEQSFIITRAKTRTTLPRLPLRATKNRPPREEADDFLWGSSHAYGKRTANSHVWPRPPRAVPDRTLPCTRPV